MKDVNAVADLIVDEIIEDLSDRGGLGDEWSNIDDDIQDEIRQQWKTIVLQALNAK